MKLKFLHPLTGLRGIAAYSVLIAHAMSTSFLYSGVNDMQPFASRLAYFGMSLFFVLSGFVIHYNYANLISSKGLLHGGYQFIIARIARLYPLYVLMLIVNLDRIPSGIFHNQNLAAFSYLTMTQSWVNLQTLYAPPMWSISTEWFFYFAYLFMLPLFRFLRNPIISLSLFLVASFIFLPNLLHWQILTFGGNQDGWITYFSPYIRIFDFIAGVLASTVFLQLNENERSIKNVYYKIGFIAIGIWIVSIMYFDVFRNTRYAILQSNFAYTPAIAPLLILVNRYNVLDKILSHRYMVFLGEISYSVYLLGFEIITALGDNYTSAAPTLNGVFNSIIKMGIIIILTTVFAYGGYILIEKPSRRYLSRVLAFKKREDNLVEQIQKT